MNKQSRHQSVVNKQSDESFGGDHWLRQFEEKLQKTSVQPRGQVLYDEISSIMNNSRAKYPSVQAAVDDMMQRSGLTGYLDKVKTSNENTPNSAKIATAQDSNTLKHKHKDMPDVIKDKPSIMQTLRNIIEETRGNMPVPAIIARLHSLHAQDIPDEGAWEDDKLILLVSQYNLQAKKDNPSSYDNFNNLGKGDHSADSDLDASNTDAFHVLMPAKI